MVWYGLVWFGMVWYGMVWFSIIWNGLIWLGMVWYCMEKVAKLSPTQDTNGKSTLWGARGMDEMRQFLQIYTCSVCKAPHKQVWGRVHWQGPQKKLQTIIVLGQ